MRPPYVWLLPRGVANGASDVNYLAGAKNMVNRILTAPVQQCGMTPIPLTRAERSALNKIVRLNGSCTRRRLSTARAQRFIQLGLLLDFRGEYHLTLKGQVEVLRQRYRGIRRRPQPITISEKTGSMLDTKLFDKTA